MRRIIKYAFLLAACLIAGSACRQGAGVQSSVPVTTPTPTDLGVWNRFLQTPWKEYGADGAVQDVVFELRAPGVVAVTISTGPEVRGEAFYRLKENRTGRFCPVRNGREVCVGDLTFDDRSVTFTFDDPGKLPERAVLLDPDTFVHSREVEGVKFDVETYASEAFDRNPAVRQRARDSMERYKRGLEEVQRRRAAGGSDSPPR